MVLLQYLGTCLGPGTAVAYNYCTWPRAEVVYIESWALSRFHVVICMFYIASNYARFDRWILKRLMLFLAYRSALKYVLVEQAKFSPPQWAPPQHNNFKKFLNGLVIQTAPHHDNRKGVHSGREGSYPNCFSTILWFIFFVTVIVCYKDVFCERAFSWRVGDRW